MSKGEVDVWPWVVAAGLAGGGIAILARIAARGSLQASDTKEANPRQRLPRVVNIPLERPFSTLDVEAAARMLASENPRGSEQLHIEQIWTQIRNRRKRQSLFDRITNGSGWGEQGEKQAPGGLRPVATTEPATDAFRTLAVSVLSGARPSRLPGARKYFEPAVQDRAFELGEAARKKLASGQPLLPKERRLLKYRKSARNIRAEWLKKSTFLDSIDGIEFYT